MLEICLDLFGKASNGTIATPVDFFGGLSCWMTANVFESFGALVARIYHHIL